MFKPKNSRVIPAAAILGIGGLMLVAAIVSGFYLNLDHQRVGFEFVYPPFVKAPHLFFDHPQGWCLALVVDMLMGGSEVISVGLTFLINYWEAKKDDLVAAGVKTESPRYKRLERKLESAKLGRKYSTRVFMGSGLISVLMVGTAFATSIDSGGKAWFQFILPVSIGCMTPLLIAASSYIFLSALQIYIDLFSEPADQEVNEQEPVMQQLASGPALEEEEEPAKVISQGQKPKGSGKRQHGANTPPRVVTSK